MIRRSIINDDDNDNKDRWLLTYADLITLLLGFFVVMYSMSRIDAKRFGDMAEGLQGIFKGGESVLDKANVDNEFGSGVLKIGKLKMIQQKINNKTTSWGKNRQKLGTNQNENNNSVKPEEQISTEINERGLVIHILESALFESGKADLKNNAIEVLNLVALEIKDANSHVRVEGHTDDRQINTIQFPSNWELSSARATAVVRHFVDNHKFPPDKISALGYGEYRPLITNNSDQNRAKNRRVDIVLLTDQLSDLEPEAKKEATASNPYSGNIMQALLEDVSDR